MNLDSLGLGEIDSVKKVPGWAPLSVPINPGADAKIVNGREVTVGPGGVHIDGVGFFPGMKATTADEGYEAVREAALQMGKEGEKLRPMPVFG